MAQAQRKITIDVPADKLYDVITDFEKYAEFLPEVKKVVVAAGPGDAKDVTYTIDIKAKTITYTLRHTGARPTKAAWVMTRGEMIKANEGHWDLKDLGGKTEATYNIDLKLSAFVPGFVEKALAETGLPDLLNNFKKRAESLYGGKA